MKVLITGSNGFIGKNLVTHLEERKDIEVIRFTREDDIAQLPLVMSEVDFVFHLAGVNRPQDSEEFKIGNIDLTQALCDSIMASGKLVPVVYTSSSQAGLDNPYGRSKLGAEEVLLELASEHGSAIHLFRLPNVFGKWAQPNYNSVVATFCHNIAHDHPIQINDADACITLVYIDDVVASFIDVLDGRFSGNPFVSFEPQYGIAIGELAEYLYAFRDSRQTMVTEAVGSGLMRALYSTYLSYIPPHRFSYQVSKHEDPRGVFVEMLKTRDSGQMSFFTAHPGVTRGGHYHHSKTEKFLVIKGKACFRFRHIVSDEFYE